MDNKWLRGALPALMIHCSIGFVYCWSLFKNEIAVIMEQPVSNVEWAFSLAIFFLGMSAAFGGNLVEKNVKKSSLISMIFFCSGLFGTALSIHYQSLVGLFISYGVIMGIGLGIGYLTPVKTLMLWFKDNKGLATGIAIMGFGLAKFIASPMIEYLMNITTLEMMFIILGTLYICPMLVGHIFIKKPDYAKDFVGTPVNLRSAWSMIINKTYLAIWFVFFINITCGLALISQEKPILEFIGMSSAVIGLIAGLTALFNSIGRLGYSTLSDKMNDRSTVYSLIFISSAIVCFLSFGGFAINNSTMLWTVLILLTLGVVNLGYGGGFSTLPSLLSDKFGMEQVSIIHGFALSAWAWAGLCGNQLAVYMVNRYGDYNELLLVLGVLYSISLLVTITLIRNKKDK